MEAVGQLAGGVAHDFNNILAAALMQLSLLRTNPSLDLKARELVRELERGAERSAELTRQLLLFGRRSLMQFKPVDLNDLLADLQKMLRRLLGEHITFEVAGDAGLPCVHADPGMIQQVVVNLCVNARDAMPRGGRLSVHTFAQVLTADQVRGSASAREGCYVCLVIADTGSGMDDATLQHIFEPFFTTKEVGRGTGLGLATVHGIVQQHRGWVEVQSAVGQGTVFRIFFPAHLEPAVPPADPPVVETIAGGHETILLVEDEPAVRETVAQLLEHWGYRVLEARNGLEAEARWREHRQDIDLLFTDLVMPGGLGGLELAERLRAEDPSLQVILSSGYSSELVQQGTPAVPDMVFLPKPWIPADLAAAIRRSLERRPQ
jgi:CheY-like chemotaxis protein